ncbi:MAG: type II and III secretion system family protein [Micavibrio aeruginosavorus]|uniref:Type II and III secretion system family protein n=1 Tax=Micavibrio aeruginosavorus TaxID=349221 RepID=A0A7T5UJ70_9BACT|nr:MAG: type II and III secretion system family protein [Micavibrio aeruginosavorus]
MLGSTALSLAVAVSVTGCDLMDNQLKTDRSAHLDFQDYRDALAPRSPEEDAASDDGSAIPDFQNYVATPTENIKPMPLVSISVNQTVPLRDVLYELAKQADYDIELDPRISGSVIFTARERPFDLVIKRISEIAGLRYKFEEDIVRVELDLPYQKSYKLDYLSYIRKNTSSIKNDVAVVTGDGAGTGSKFETEATSEADFWAELNAGITQILGADASSGQMKTSGDPQITAVEPTAAPVAPVAATPVEGAGAGGEGADAQPVVQVQPPDATLQVSALPSVGGSAEPVEAGSSTFSINKQAGVISVMATERQHEQLAAYLDEVRTSTTAQVLIEAKVMEVSLDDKYAAGINWELLQVGDLAAEFTNSGSLARPFLSGETSSESNFSLSVLGNDVTAAVDALSKFGTVHALASPRMTVLNNQSAVLNVANNEVYFELDIDVSSTDAGTQITVDSQIRNVPEGVLINVQPSINLENRTVSMAVRPTVTRIVEFKEDPGVAFVVAQAAAAGSDIELESGIPVVNVQEMDSIIKVSSGQAIVLGGLLQDRATSTERGVPVLSEIPLFGNVFKNHTDSIEKTELVIFLKATIIDADGDTVDQIDKDIYRRFSGDRRPLDL